MQSFEELITAHTQFTLATFTEATVTSSLVKLDEEVAEVITELLTPTGNLSEEYADCLMCLFDSAARAGLSIDAIKVSFAQKLEKNKGRTWVKKEDNTYSHT